MNGHDLLESVQPGFQGMLPPDPADLNPNQQPDPLINRKLGKPLGYNPVAIALNRRETIQEIEKAIEQLIATALLEGVILSRPNAIAKVKTIWAQRQAANPTSSTSPNPNPQQTSSLPLSPQQKQDFLNRLQQKSKVTTTPSEATTPQPSTPEVASPPELIEIEAPLQPEQAPPSVAAIKRALTTDSPDTFAEEITATLDHEPTDAAQIDAIHKDVVAVFGPGKPSEASLRKGEGPPVLTCGNTIEVSNNEADDVFAAIEDSGPDELSEEIKADIYKTLHESTEGLLKYLPRRNCLQFFRQSLALVGLPQWSRWTPKMREQVQEAYIELATDPYEVDVIVRHLQAFSARYGKQRLLRMTATLLGLQAWMSLDLCE